MKTVSNCVEDILITQPYLEEALSRKIINFSALAIELVEPISKMLKKDVKPGAIILEILLCAQTLLILPLKTQRP